MSKKGYIFFREICDVYYPKNSWWENAFAKNTSSTI